MPKCGCTTQQLVETHTLRIVGPSCALEQRPNTWASALCGAPPCSCSSNLLGWINTGLRSSAAAASRVANQPRKVAAETRLAAVVEEAQEAAATAASTEAELRRQLAALQAARSSEAAAAIAAQHDLSRAVTVARVQVEALRSDLKRTSDMNLQLRSANNTANKFIILQSYGAQYFDLPAFCPGVLRGYYVVCS